MYSKIQPDNDPVVSKHGAEWILYKIELAGYLFTPYFKIIRLSNVKKDTTFSFFKDRSRQLF
jgi:hypothetical protein